MTRLSNQIVAVDPTCLPILLKKVNSDGSTKDDDLKLELRNTEILIFWEPNPTYNCVVIPAPFTQDADQCTGKTPPKISLYAIFEKYILAEADGQYTEDESGMQLFEPLEGVNILGGAESSIKYGTLSATVNLLGMTVYSWGGSFMKGVKIVVPGLDEDHPCFQPEKKSPPPCPETDAGFTVGSLVSRIITIKDTIGSNSSSERQLNDQLA